MAEDIAHGFAVEMRRPDKMAEAASASVVGLLLQELSDKLVALLGETAGERGRSEDHLDEMLGNAEKRLAALVKVDSDGRNGASVPTVVQPNLKYRKPKYENVESILKYVEQQDDKGGVKLVIMNFND